MTALDRVKPGQVWKQTHRGYVCLILTEDGTYCDYLRYSREYGVERCRGASALGSGPCAFAKLLSDV